MSESRLQLRRDGSEDSSSRVLAYPQLLQVNTERRVHERAESLQYSRIAESRGASEPSSLLVLSPPLGWSQARDLASTVSHTTSSTGPRLQPRTAPSLRSPPSCCCSSQATLGLRTTTLAGSARSSPTSPRQQSTPSGTSATRPPPPPSPGLLKAPPPSRTKSSTRSPSSTSSPRRTTLVQGRTRRSSFSSATR